MGNREVCATNRGPRCKIEFQGQVGAPVSAPTLATLGAAVDFLCNYINPTFARYPAVSRQDPAFDRLGQRQTAVAAGEKAARSRRSRATNAELGRFAPSYAHLPCRLLTAQHPCDAHAGAGGARSWAINDRMSANICLDTATSAIWKVT